MEKGSKVQITNYRPSSITSPVSKILEKLMGNRLISFIDKFHLLYDYQFGFRKHFSTSFALIDVLNMVQNENYKNNYVLAVFMDLKKAFDTVNLNIVLEKLKHYGIRGFSLNSFKSFLLNRSQYTYVNFTQSCSLESSSRKSFRSFNVHFIY